MSVRLKLTISYAAMVVLAGGVLFVVLWLLVLRHLPPGTIVDDIFGRRRALYGIFTPATPIALLFLAAIGLVGGWFLAGRMLRPLDRITEATRLVAKGSLSHRINLTGPRDEFHELADAVDMMLARLEAHVGEQQRFAANASHELRTPLAIAQSMLDVARDDPHRDVEKLIERLTVVNARAIDLTEALLLLSRIDQRTFAREPVDLALLVEEAIETLLPLAEKNSVEVESNCDDVMVVGSPPLLLQLVTNLIHNAIVHNLSAGGTVQLRTATAPEAVVLVVENTGPVVPADRVATLVEPFHRGTGRTRTDHAGTGLGLAIADSIIRAHGGTLTLTPRPEGGLVAELRVPIAA